MDEMRINKRGKAFQEMEKNVTRTKLACPIAIIEHKNIKYTMRCICYTDSQKLMQTNVYNNFKSKQTKPYKFIMQ